MDREPLQELPADWLVFVQAAEKYPDSMRLSPSMHKTMSDYRFLRMILDTVTVVLDDVDRLGAGKLCDDFLRVLYCSDIRLSRLQSGKYVWDYLSRVAFPVREDYGGRFTKRLQRDDLSSAFKATAHCRIRETSKHPLADNIIYFDPDMFSLEASELPSSGDDEDEASDRSSGSGSSNEW